MNFGAEKAKREILMRQMARSCRQTGRITTHLKTFAVTKMSDWLTDCVSFLQSLPRRCFCCLLLRLLLSRHTLFPCTDTLPFARFTWMWHCDSTVTLPFCHFTKKFCAWKWWNERRKKKRGKIKTIPASCCCRGRSLATTCNLMR